MSKKSSLPDPAPTDKTAATTAGDEGGTTTLTAPKAVLINPTRPVPQPAARGKTRRSCKGLYWGLLVMVTAMAGALALVLNQTFNQIRDDAAARNDALAAALQTVERNADDALVLARAQTQTITQLQGALTQIQRHYQTLEARMSTSADSSEIMRVNDVEHLLRQADQQLRLGGPVANAIVALELALARLTLPQAGAERPEQVLLRQTLEDDLAQLRTVPVVDVAAQMAQVDRLIALTERAPLWVADLVADLVTDAGAASIASDAAPSESLPSPANSTSATEADPAAPWWQRAGRSVAAWSARAVSGLGRDVRGLLSVQRVADANALLLAPEQATQLRATLRLRLLSAQVALLMGQTRAWHTELANVQTALATYYDGQAPATHAALQLAHELAQANVTVTRPDLTASVNAVAVLRAALAYTPQVNSNAEGGN